MKSKEKLQNLSKKEKERMILINSYNVFGIVLLVIDFKKSNKIY